MMGSTYEAGYGSPVLLTISVIVLAIRIILFIQRAMERVSDDPKAPAKENKSQDPSPPIDQREVPQPPLQTEVRTTPLQYNYAVFTTETKPKKSRKWLTALIILVVLGGLSYGAMLYVNYLRTESDTALIKADFEMMYENPSGNKYTIILDDWDTIAIHPYSTSSSVNYTVRREQREMHWVILDSVGNKIADTTIFKNDVITYFGMGKYYEPDFYKRIVLLNPARVDYLFWKLHVREGRADSVRLQQIEPGEYYPEDAIVTRSCFIFDRRVSANKTEADKDDRFVLNGDYEFLISGRDFPVLYGRIFPKQDNIERYDNLRRELFFLYESVNKILNSAGRPDLASKATLSRLEPLIPTYINNKTTPKTFQPGIDYVKQNHGFFSRIDPQKCGSFLDSARIIMNLAYKYGDTPKEFLPLARVGYTVYHNGFLEDEPLRSEYVADGYYFDAR